MRAESPWIVALLVIAAAACDRGGAAGAAVPATFQAVVENVLAPRCTFSSCHAEPTVAANLDLTAEQACGMLINRPSCLVPDRMRIVPGAPEESFLFHKLTGQKLGELPANSSCSSETQSNLPMPYGGIGPPADDEIALVRDWIAAGAQCTGAGEPPAPPAPPAPAIASFTADRGAPLAGEVVTLTVALDRMAPEGGQRIDLETETSALAAPLQVTVPAGQVTARFDAYALRPTSEFVLRARAGQSTREIALRIGGLEIAEVLADPAGDNDDKLQWITGTIGGGECAVIGGPTSSEANGDPVFSQAVDFSTDLPHGDSQATGFALFDRTASAVARVPTPVDAMLVGGHNEAGLLGPDAGATACTRSAR